MKKINDGIVVGKGLELRADFRPKSSASSIMRNFGSVSGTLLLNPD
jgi:hypothetical protein